MAGDKIIPRSESGAAPMKTSSSKFATQDLTSGKSATPSNSTSTVSSAGYASSSSKGEIHQESVAGKSVYYPPSSYYNYSYPGYNGNFGAVDEYNYSGTGSGSYSDFPSDDGSLMYYLPGYDSYGSGSFMGLDGQQQYYSSAGYTQNPMSFAPEALHGYSWNPANLSNPNSGANKSKSTFGSNRSAKSSSSNSNQGSSSSASRPTVLRLDQKTGKYVPVTPVAENGSQSMSSWGKVGSGYQTASGAKGLYPFGKYSSSYNQSQGFPMHRSPASYGSNRTWNGNKKNSYKHRNGDIDASTELTCGPRIHGANAPSDQPKEEQVGRIIRKGQHTAEEFKTEYEAAKFFVIKSYSEDDVHKSIKYDVWSSTPNGNKKLNAAYNAVANASEAGARIPVFLFFSVNGSGQFVGVAEMVGPVNFNSDMEFWQLDKWSGSFPLKWHIVKDVPNAQLRHIIVETNDNRPVTFSRDTQEVGLKEGNQMLNIFKNFSAKTSLLDDFNFYEIREKSLRAKRSSADQASSASLSVQRGSSVVAAEPSSSADVSLISLTRNLSLNSRPQMGVPADLDTSDSAKPSAPSA